MKSEETTLPREKLEQIGARALSDEELLTVVLGSGSAGNGVRAIAQRLLPLLDGHDPLKLGLDVLRTVKGVGRSKGLQILAAMEFARRRIRPEGTRITCAKDVLPLVNHLLDRPQEHVVSISLSGAHEVIRVRTVSIGLLASCPVHPREVFIGAIRDHAYSVILAHNHPSGDPQPSEEDKRVTEQLRAAATTLGIKLLDHVVFARRGYYSFQEAGAL
jgi:DNA repair protein RadC